ncbi:hypothetical protein RND15_52965, partial [Streptomyces sp. DSM 41529]|nr:hypothetical protein [Streptomyces sp. DSM 41529]
PAAIRLLAALAYDLIVLETVGVGQSEIEIAAIADPTVVILNPGAGDAVQAAKAGLLEVADLVVVNKADREGADQTARVTFGPRRLFRCSNSLRLKGRGWPIWSMPSTLTTDPTPRRAAPRGPGPRSCR